MAVTRFIRMWLVPVAAVALMVGGVIGIVIATPQSASFGWFAYAPLSGTVFSPDGSVIVSWGAIAGAAAIALGAAVLAFWASLRIAMSRAKGNR